MVEQNRDIRTARSLQTDEGNDRQRQTDIVEIEVSGFSGQHVKHNVRSLTTAATVRPGLFRIISMCADQNIK